MSKGEGRMGPVDAGGFPLPDEAARMIRSTSMLLRHARDFFHAELVGLYSFDKDVVLDAPERRPEIPPNVDRKTRREMMEQRQGKGKFLEKERLRFGPWEILIYSAEERG